MLQWPKFAVIIKRHLNLGATPTKV